MNQDIEKVWRDSGKSERIFKPIGKINVEHFNSKVSKKVLDSGCWNWNGSLTPNGYGSYRAYGAHRVAYTIKHGDIPEGLVIDHICRNRKCVNPEHLRAVTHRTNCIENSVNEDIRNRGFCPKGHALDDLNTYTDKRFGSKVCKRCRADGMVIERMEKEIAQLKLKVSEKDEALDEVSRIHLQQESEIYYLERESEQLKGEVESYRGSCGMHTINEIKQLKEELKRERECVDFYASRDNWDGENFNPSTKSRVVERDMEDGVFDSLNDPRFKNFRVGGKRARETQSKRKCEV